MRVPPLRERVDDIDLLVRVFLDLFGAAEADDLFTPDVLAGLRAHSWPGNVRELQNVIERAVILCNDSGMLEPAHLGITPLAAPATAAGQPAAGEVCDLRRFAQRPLPVAHGPGRTDAPGRSAR